MFHTVVAQFIARLTCINTPQVVVQNKFCYYRSSSEIYFAPDRMIPHRPVHIHPDTSTIFVTGRTYAGISWLYPNHTKQFLYDKLQEILPRYHIELDAHVICHNHYHLLLRVARGDGLSKFVKHLHGATARYIKQHMPEIVTLGGQILTREITPWDRRQNTRLHDEEHDLARRINSATTEMKKREVVAKFISHHPIIERRLKSATTKENVLANFSSHQRNDVLAQFIARFISHPDILILLSKDPPIWHQYMDHVIRSETDYYKHLNYTHQNPVKHGLAKRMTEYPWSSIHRWVEEWGKEFMIDCFRQYPIANFKPIMGAE